MNKWNSTCQRIGCGVELLEVVQLTCASTLYVSLYNLSLPKGERGRDGGNAIKKGSEQTIAADRCEAEMSPGCRIRSECWDLQLIAEHVLIQ
jgi:hypothetical protein